jgi:hypothetical protein
MVLKRLYTPAAYLSCVLVAAVGFWILYESYEVYGVVGDDRYSSLPISELGDDVTRLSVRVDVDDADLSLSSSTSGLVRCYYDEPLNRPVIKLEENEDLAEISVEEGGFTRWSWFESYDVLPDWSLKVDNSLPLSLKLNSEHSDIRLRVADFSLEELDCDVRYSSVDLRIGDLARELTASMRIDRSEIRVRIPAIAGVEILDADDFDDFYVGDLDFITEGGRLVTANFERAPVKLSFELNGSARIFRITRY